MVIAILMVIIGLVAMTWFPVRPVSRTRPPEIKVETTYTGADALTVEQSWPPPSSSQMSGVDYMNYMYSTNANNGMMTLKVIFDVKTDTNIDQVLTQMRQNQASSQTPGGSAQLRRHVQKSTSSR